MMLGGRSIILRFLSGISPLTNEGISANIIMLEKVRPFILSGGAFSDNNYQDQMILINNFDRN